MGADIPDPTNISGQPDTLADLIDRLQRRVRYESRRCYEPLGVTPAQVRALRTLHRAGSPLRMSEVAARLGIARRSATDVVEQLAARSLVERRPDSSDGRAVVIALTAAGSALLDATTAARQQATDRLLAPLTGAERAHLAAALGRVLSQHEEPAAAP